jgi:hypothetical protein
MKIVLDKSCREIEIHFGSVTPPPLPRHQRTCGLRRGSGAALLLEELVSVVSDVYCQVEVLRRADHSSRGVPPRVMRLSVITKFR